jgi:trigger factor
MSFDLKIEEANSIQRRLRFTLDGAEVALELDRAYSNLGRSARVPGFRAGKVPRNVLEARFGKSVQGEVTQRLISRGWQQAVGDLEVAGEPALEEQSELRRGQPFSFTIAVEVKPTLEVKDYTGLEVRYPVGAVTDEQLDRAVARRLQSQMKIEEVTEDRAVTATDLVVTELVLTDKDGKELANEPGTMVNMQGERYYPGVEPLLLGLKKGEERTDTVTIGQSAIEALTGVEASARVKVVGIQAQVVPPLSDEIAAELKYEGGAEGMKNAIKAQLQEQVDETSKNQARANLLRVLVDANAFDVPTGLVNEQHQALLEELRIRRAYSGQDPRTMRLSDAEAADLRERATFAAKASCILMAVAKQEGIEAEEADVQKKIQEIADLRGQAPEAIRAYLDRDGAMGTLQTRILEEKTLEWLIERAKLVEEKPGEATAEAAPDAEGEAKPKKKKSKKSE